MKPALSDVDILDAAKKYKSSAELIAFTEGYVKGLTYRNNKDNGDNGYKNNKRYPGLKDAVLTEIKRNAEPMTSKDIAKSIHHAYDMPIAVLNNRVGVTLNNLFKKGFVAKARNEYNVELAAVRPCGGLVYRGELWQACVVRRLFIL
jgi:hypothetical protein